MLCTIVAVGLIALGVSMDMKACMPEVYYPKASVTGALVSMGTFLFAFSGHQVFPTIQHDMYRPVEFTKSVILGFGSEFLFPFLCPHKSIIKVFGAFQILYLVKNIEIRLYFCLFIWDFRSKSLNLFENKCKHKFKLPNFVSDYKLTNDYQVHCFLSKCSKDLIWLLPSV